MVTVRGGKVAKITSPAANRIAAGTTKKIQCQCRSSLSPGQRRQPSRRWPKIRASNDATTAQLDQGARSENSSRIGDLALISGCLLPVAPAQFGNGVGCEFAAHPHEIQFFGRRPGVAAEMAGCDSEQVTRLRQQWNG